MSARLLACAVAAAALVQGVPGANAASTPNANSSNNATRANDIQQLPQEIKNKLQQDGFSDVKVVPGSFFVTAKDKNGDNVNMIIGPGSMMVMEQASAQPKVGTDQATNSSQQ